MTPEMTEADRVVLALLRLPDHVWQRVESDRMMALASEGSFRTGIGSIDRLIRRHDEEKSGSA